MKATIVTIGDEILIGQIVDTNSGYIAKELDKIGVQTTEILSISDDKQHILDTLAYLQNKVQLVIITGGLGPTKDDITKHTFCEYFQDHLVRNESIEKHVIELIESALKRPASQMNKDQALVPSSATILFNKVGTAPGMWIQKENTVFVSLPGVPYEMKHIMENAIIPKVITDFKRPFIIHKTILTYGQGESLVAERIEDWESNLPEFIKLAYLPAPGRVRLRLTARGIDKEYLQDAIDGKVETLTKILKDIIVGYNDSETIEVILGQVLTKNNQTLATAESCTGGKLAQLITSIAGASAYFRGSVVTYATDTKISTLGVSLETIKEHSVVSLQVAKEMALGVQKLMKSDFAIATTGNAGPSKGDENANLGVVCIAIATPNGVFAEEFSFGQPREKVIDRTVNKAFEMVLKEILKNV
ncbi:MAG: nicotinamide-nucleotide amidase [Flavobacterium sp.]